ncbi:glycoside hydrolase domain-containing protein [Spiroplasma endosymbiont of Othius punctulatus]|uniref:glycoside hydrolase domain-containing protein n=1 Tax=Spiroplasma endosymbiont of Othius punctulatus TaxID=3066289 RepID=UPI0030D33E67
MNNLKSVLILASILCVFCFSFFITSCARFLDYGVGNIGSNIPKDLKDDFLFQDGCSSTTKTTNFEKDENLAGFLGESLFHYSSYVDTNNGKSFFGNKSNALKCDGNTFVKSVWKGQTINLQFVLMNKDISNKIKNLKVTLSGDEFKLSNNDSLKDDKNIVGWAKFNKFIKTPKPANSNSKHLYDQTLYVPDAVGITELDEMKYDVQPIYISMKVGHKVNPGLKKMKLKVSYEINEKKLNFDREFKVKISDRDLIMNDPNEKESDKFGFTAQTFPADSLSYWYDDSSLFYQTPIDRGPDDAHRAAYVRDDMAKNYLRQFLQPLKDSNASFAFAPGYHKQIIQWTANFKNDLSISEIENLISEQSFESIMSSYENDIEFNFLFNSMAEYLDILTEVGLPALDISLFENGKFSSWVVPKDSVDGKGPQVDWTAKIINSNSGKPESDFDMYIKKIITPLLKSLIDMMHNGYKEKRFILENGNKIRILLNTDELNEKSMDAVQEVIDDVNDYGKNKYSDFTPIGMNSFVGWRSSIDLGNENYLNNNFINSYDQFVFHTREINSAVDNTTWKKLENSITKRKNNNKSTMFYSTYGDYPGSYMASDISESLWNVLFGRKLNLNGFLRWAYDKTYDDYFMTEDFNSIETGDEVREPGQSFLIYGGDNQNGVHYSVRMLAMIEAVQNVYKFNALQKSEKDKKMINQAMNNIGITQYAHNNNSYKWNVGENWKFLYMTPNVGYKKPVAMQVFEFMKTLEKY